MRTNARNALEAMSDSATLAVQAQRWREASERAAASSTADQARVAELIDQLKPLG